MLLVGNKLIENGSKTTQQNNDTHKAHSMSVMKGNLPRTKTRFQKILATCIPPRNTRLERMSMAVENAERKAMQRLLIVGERFCSWEIRK